MLSAFQKGGKNNVDKVASLESVSIFPNIIQVLISVFFNCLTSADMLI